MMRHLILFLLLYLWSSAEVSSQTLIGTITNENLEPLPFAEVYDSINNNRINGDVNGTFVLNLEHASSNVSIYHPEYQTERFLLPDSLQPTDTITRIFVLLNKVQLVEEMQVYSERMQTVFDEANMNVRDFLPINDGLLVLSSQKRRCTLSILAYGKVVNSFELNNCSAHTLYRDCFGNIHLIGDKEATQIWLDNDLHYISTSPIKEFESTVANCTGNFEKTTVFETFSNRNKKYTLTAINKERRNKKHFYHCYDKAGERVARTHYRLIIMEYFKRMPEYKNVISLGVWTGDLKELDVHKDIHTMIAWYRVKEARLKIQTFQNDQGLLTFNQFNDSIYYFDNEFNTMESEHYPFAKSNRIFDVIQDYGTSKYYELTQHNGIYTLTGIPVWGEDNSGSLSINEVPFAEKIKIHDNWVYFLLSENGFNSIQRIAIE